MAQKEKSGNTTIKLDIVDRVYERVGFTRKEAADAVEILFDEIKAKLSQGEKVSISGFATFNVRQKKSRNARNPKTGEPIVIKARKVLVFKPSKQLLAATDRARNEPGNT